MEKHLPSQIEELVTDSGLKFVGAWFANEARFAACCQELKALYP